VLPIYRDGVDDFGVHDLSPEIEISIDEVSSEFRIGGIIPDLVLKSGNRELIVEIAVTHFVDIDKCK